MDLSVRSHEPIRGADTRLYPGPSTLPVRWAPTIHVIDHDDAVRDSLSVALAARGLPVLAFGSAAQYLDRPSTKADVCLLIELDLPDMTGTDLIDALALRHGRPPAIIMSARLHPPELRACRSKSVVGLLPKPFGQDALWALLQRALDPFCLIEERLARGA